MMHTRTVPAAMPLALLSLVATAVAQDGVVSPVGPATARASLGTAYDLNIVHVNTPGHPTNVVPGLGIPFTAGGNSASGFERPFTSGNGTQFAIRANAATGSTATDNVLLLNGALLLQEGTQSPWGATGENTGVLDADFGINDLGEVLLGNNTSATTNDDYIVRFSGGSWTILAQEAGSVTTVLPALVGGTWDDTMDTTVLTNVGAIWRATGIDGLAGGTANDAVVVLAPGLALQKGVDVPLNQAGGATNAWEVFDLNDTYVAPNGGTTLVQGDLLGATTSDDVIVVSGVVMLQEGSPIAGGPFVEPVDAEGFVKGWVDRGGNWYVRGNNDVTEQDWVVRNGTVVAFSDGGNEIVPGSGEHWSDTDFADCFFAFDGNSLGQYVIGGVTDAPSTQNGVIVFDDGAGFRRVIVRENDPIDLDGNGLFDDDRFFNTFGNDDVLLLDDGTIIVVATLRNGVGTAVDQGLFRITPKQASCTLRNGTGVNPVQFTCTTLPELGTSWTMSTQPNANTILSFAFVAFLPSPPIPLFGGEVLVDASAVPISGPGTHTINLPASVAWLGLPLFTQGVRIDLVGGNPTIVLLNAQDAVLGL